MYAFDCMEIYFEWFGYGYMIYVFDSSYACQFYPCVFSVQ